MNNKRDKPFKTDFTILFEKIKKKKKKALLTIISLRPHNRASLELASTGQVDNHCSHLP